MSSEGAKSSLLKATSLKWRGAELGWVVFHRPSAPSPIQPSTSSLPQRLNHVDCISRHLCLLIPSWVWPMASILRGQKDRKGVRWSFYPVYTRSSKSDNTRIPLFLSNSSLSVAIPFPWGTNCFPTAVRLEVQHCHLLIFVNTAQII